MDDGKEQTYIINNKTCRHFISYYRAMAIYVESIGKDLHFSNGHDIGSYSNS